LIPKNHQFRQFPEKTQPKIYEPFGKKILPHQDNPERINSSISQWKEFVKYTHWQSPCNPNLIRRIFSYCLVEHLFCGDVDYAYAYRVVEGFFRALLSWECQAVWGFSWGQFSVIQIF
jgi:hypothetical protein